MGKNGKSTMILQKQKTKRDKKYLQFIRSLCCCFCGSSQNIESHHMVAKGHGAKGLKTSDLRAVPLCFECHRGIHQIGKLSFLKQKQITIDEIEGFIAYANTYWERYSSSDGI